MFKIYDGREYFYQWDLDRKLIVYDETIQEVHFWNKTDDCCLVCEVYTEGDLRLVNVPNILLQDNWRINAYGYDGSYTKHSDRFDVNSRAKPADYIYTETECKRWDDLEERITALEENSGSGGSADLTGYATEEYVNSKISKVEEDINTVGNKVEDIEGEFGNAIPYIDAANAGQVLSIANVNETGIPIEWKAIDLPTGGSDDVLLADFTLENDVTDFTVDSNDTETKFKALYFELSYYSRKTNLNGEDTKATHLWVCVNDAKCWLSNASTTANAEGCVYGWLNLTEFNSFGFVIGSANKVNIINSGGSYNVRIISSTQPQQNFMQFRCFTHNGVNLIGAGTHLRVWGVNV